MSEQALETADGMRTLRALSFAHNFRQCNRCANAVKHFFEWRNTLVFKGFSIAISQEPESVSRNEMPCIVTRLNEFTLLM